MRSYIHNLLLVAIFTACYCTSLSVVAAQSDCTVTLNAGGNIQAAINQANPGTTICLEEGMYTGQRLSISRSGTAGNPITLRSKSSSQRAIIDCSNCEFPPGSDGKSYGSVLHISGQHIVIQDITFQNTGRYDVLYKHTNIDDSVKGITIARGQHIKLLNLIVDRIVGICVLTDQADDVEISGGTYSNCNLENHPDVRAAHPDPKWSWNWGSGFSITHASTKVAIRNITHFNSWGEGINFWAGANDGIIENNTVYNVWGPAIYVDRARNIVVRNNSVHVSKMSDGVIGRPIEVMNEAGKDNHVTEAYPRFDNILIYNNLVITDQDTINQWGEKPLCIHIGEYETDANKVPLTLHGHVTFANNTCIGTRSGKNSNADAQNIQYINNLYIDATQPGEYAAGALISHNAWSNTIDATATSPYKGAGNIFGMANFPYTNLNSPTGPLTVSNFKLTSGDFDFINKGTTALSNTDILGCPRIGAPDMGAFEYNPSCVTSGGPPAATPTPTPTTSKTGDIIPNNCVDIFDYNALIASFGKRPGDDKYLPAANLTGSADVDIFDYSIVIQNFGQGCR